MPTITGDEAHAEIGRPLRGVVLRRPGGTHATDAPAADEAQLS